AGKDGRVRQWALPLKPTVVFASPEAVLASHVTPDGARLVTGSNDKMVRTWTLSNQKMERQFAGHTGPVTAVAMSANGQILASGSADASIRLWNPGNGQPAGELYGHVGPVTSLVVHPSGQQLLSSGEDGTIKLWKLPVTPPKALTHPDQVTSAVLSPDGSRILTGCNDKQVRQWNLNGQAERTFGGLTGVATSVAYSPNAALVAAGGADKSIMVWQAGDAKVVKRIENLPNVVQSVALSPDNKTVAAGFADNIIRLYNIADGKEIKPIMGHGGPVTALLYTPKGDLLISGSADKSVQLWSAADGANKGKIDHPAAVTSLALNKDGSKLATGCADKSARIYTLADKKAVATIATPAEVRGVDMNGDSTRVIVANADNKARIYGADGKLLEIVDHKGPVNAVAYQPQGTVVVSASADKNVLLSTPAVIWQGSHAGPVRQAVFNAQGNQAFSVSDDKTLKQWNQADGKELKAVAAHGGPVLGVGLSSDNNKIVTIGADKTLKVWPAALDKPAATATLTGVPHGLSVAPNGTRAAVSFVDDKNATLVQAIDLGTGSELQTIRDHKGAVPALNFLNDNRVLVSAGADKNVRLTDIGAIGAFDAHPGGVAGVAVSNNNVQVLTGGADKTVKLWDTTANKPVTTLKTFGTMAEPVVAVAFSRDYTQAGAAAGKTVKVWNVNDGKEAATLEHPATVTSLSFSLDKTKMITGSADGFSRVWDLGTGQVLELYKHAMPVRAVAFHNNNVNSLAGGDDKQVGIDALSAQRVVQPSPKPLRAMALTANGSHALVGGDDQVGYLFNNGNFNQERVFKGAEGPIRAVALTKNNTLVAIGGDDKVVRLSGFDAKPVADLKAPGGVRCLDFSPNQQSLAAGCDDKSLVTWNVVYNPGQPVPPDFGKETGRYAHDAAITDVVFAPDSVYYFSSSLDKSIREWKFASDTPVKNFGHPNLVDAAAFNPDMTLLATGCHDGNLRLWDMAKNQPKQIAAHVKPAANPIYCVTWSKDGNQLVTGSLDQSLKLWDAKSGNMVREFKAYDEKAFPKGHQEGVFCAAFSPDGKVLASGSSDRTIKLWDVNSGQVIRELVNPNIKPPAGALPGPPQSHPGWVYKVAFTDDGKYLISVGNAPRNMGFLAVWNPADGKLLHSEELPIGPIYALAISPDKKWLVVGGGPRQTQAEKVQGYILKMPDVVK
ncbi:MAG: WD40 repeat domain-containing protein, partial [Gemmataceae bacterium]